MSERAATKTRSGNGGTITPGRNVVAVASGKGGVGKTFFAITLTHAIARAGQRSLLFDGDLGLANVDVHLGLNPVKNDLGRVLTGKLPLSGAVQAVESAGFSVIAGRSGSAALSALAPAQISGLGRALLTLAPNYDRVVLDMGAGLDRTVRTLTAHAMTNLVIINEDPTALTDAYAFIKLTKQQRPNADLRVVVNLASSQRDGERAFGALRRACESFLGIQIPLLGVVRRDTLVTESIRRQAPLLVRHPNSAAAEDIEAIAQKLMEPR
jgi:flagellar biosynthesis protein FlhG